MNAQFCNDMQYGGWHKTQSANEDEVRFSALASMCLADDDLAGSQLCPGTPSSLPRDKVVVNPLSLYSSFLGFQAQHASSGHDKIIISALRNFHDDKPKETEGPAAFLPLPRPMKAGAFAAVCVARKSGFFSGRGAGAADAEATAAVVGWGAKSGFFRSNAGNPLDNDVEEFKPAFSAAAKAAPRRRPSATASRSSRASIRARGSIRRWPTVRSHRGR
jgi:hypothetical protein